MTQKNVEDCKNTTLGLLCSPTEPVEVTHKIYRNNREILPQIEYCADKRPPDVFANCEVLTVPHENKLIQLNKNTYYLYIINETLAHIKCMNVNRDIPVKETSTIGIKSECQIYLGNATYPMKEEIYMKSILDSTINTSNKAILKPTCNQSTINDLLQKYPFPLISTIFLFTLISATWFFIAYKGRKIILTMSSMKRIKEIYTSPKLDFVCSFKFNPEKPDLPPRNRRPKIKYSYDSPRSNKRASKILPCQSASSSSLLEESVNSVVYAEVHRPNPHIYESIEKSKL